MTSSRQGNTIVIAILIAVIVAVGGFLLYQSFKTTSQLTSNTQVTNQAAVTDDVPSAPTITTTADLTTAATVLDQTDLSANVSDSTQLDTELYGVLGVRP